MESNNTLSCQEAIHGRLIAMLGKKKYGSITKEALQEQKLDFTNINGYSIIPYSLIESYMNVEEQELTKRCFNEFKHHAEGNIDAATDRIIFIVLNFDVSDNEEDSAYAKFKNASYICLLLCPLTFPQSPPHLYSVTPNGYYAKKDNGMEGTVICINIGSYHSNSYPAIIGITGFSYAV